VAQTIGYKRPAASHVERPSRALLTIRPARQDAVLLLPMTTTALPLVKGVLSVLLLLKVKHLINCFQSDACKIKIKTKLVERTGQIGFGSEL